MLGTKWWPRWKILRMKVKNIDDEGEKYWWWWWQILMMIVTNINDDGEKYWHASVCQTVCAPTKQARPQFGVMRPNELWHQGTNLCRPFLEAAYWKNLIKDFFWAKMSRVISVRYPLKSVPEFFYTNYHHSHFTLFALFTLFTLFYYSNCLTLVKQ